MAATTGCETSDRGSLRRIGMMGPGGAMTGIGTGPHAEPAALLLAGLDADLDAIITPQDVVAASDRLWTSGDANKDGSISVLELNDWRVHWFGAADGWPGQFHFDADGNGQIAKTEFEAGLMAIFKEFDSDKDGKVGRAALLSKVPSDREGSKPGPQTRQDGGPARIPQSGNTGS